MITKIVQPGDTFKVFYKNTDLDGGTVTFNGWNEFGTKVLDNVEATYIPGSQVCYVEHTAPNYNSYLLFLASDTLTQEPSVIRVGDAVSRVYTWDAKPRRIIRYDIFDETGSKEKGVLKHIAGGFYSAEIGITKPWFVEFKNRAILKSTE